MPRAPRLPLKVALRVSGEGPCPARYQALAPARSVSHLLRGVWPGNPPATMPPLTGLSQRTQCPARSPSHPLQSGNASTISRCQRATRTTTASEGVVPLPSQVQPRPPRPADQFLFHIPILVPDKHVVTRSADRHRMKPTRLGALDSPRPESPPQAVVAVVDSVQHQLGKPASPGSSQSTSWLACLEPRALPRTRAANPHAWSPAQVHLPGVPGHNPLRLNGTASRDGGAAGPGPTMPLSSGVRFPTTRVTVT
jgi:hypothetical protein